MDACLLHETTCAVACLRNQEGSGRGSHVVNADTCTWCTLGNGHDRSKVMNRFGGILCSNPNLFDWCFFFHFHPHPLSLSFYSESYKFIENKQLHGDRL